MKQGIKRAIHNIMRSVVKISSHAKVGQYLNSQYANTLMDQSKNVIHRGVQLTYAVPNRLCLWRIETFASKEPETLEWIDTIPQESVLWDIGANVGLYATYAAKSRNCLVWAFEPSVFNLEVLARNIFYNKLSDKVCIIPIALNDQMGSSKLRLTSTEWSGALSTFGKDYGWDGKPIDQVFEYQIFGISMEDAINKLGIPAPDYIKMDVDGIEHIILSGGTNVLKNIEGILIEINDDFHEQADQCSTILKQAGLVLKEKRHSEIAGADPEGFGNTFNQIWMRA